MFNCGLPKLVVGVWLFFTSLQLTAAPSIYEYYILNPRIENGALSVISLADRNTIQVGATTLTLNRYQTGSIPAGPDLTPGMVISATGPFTLGSQVDATDLPVPGHFIGTKFVIPHFRNDHTYYILSPKADAQVTITLSGTPTVVTAQKGQVLSYSAGSINNISGLIQSDQPILISHAANGGAYDVYPVPPVARELWGIRSYNAIVGAMEDSTTITVMGSSGAIENFSLNAGGYRALTIPSGSQGSGSGVHIVADKPIAAIQSADNDGAETTAFLDSPYLATHYGLPINTQYVAVVCPQFTNVTLTNGAATETLPCAGNGTQPGKAYFGSITNGTNINAGAHLEADRPVYIYYEASATNDEHNITGRKDNYYSLNSRFQNGPLSVMSLVDNNWISAGSSTLFLNQHERGAIAGSELLPGTEIWGTGPFTLGSEVDGTDLPVPGSFAGTTFVIPHARDTHTYYLSSPYGEAAVSVDIGGAVSNYTVIPDQVVNINAGSDTTIAGIIKSDRPILVSHQAGTSGDAYPVPPASTELWGIRSTGAHMAAVENNTTVRVYSSDAQTATYTLNAGIRQNINIGVGTSQGQGAALHLIADKPIAAYQVADSDGYEATAFLQRTYHGTRFGLPIDTQYVAIVCPTSGTNVTLYESLKAPVTQTCSGIADYPGKLYFGSATNGKNIIAGAYLDADQPIYIIYESSTTNDEHNLLGYNLLVPPDPSVPVLNALPATTTDNPLAVTGTATPNMEVRLYVNGTQQATTRSSSTDGGFSFSAALFDDSNEIYATTWDGSQESHHSNVETVSYQNILLREINSTNNNLTIISNTVWTPGSTPTTYTIAGVLTVAAGATLTLQPGVTLEFGANSQLLVQTGGSLVIQGEADNQIVLTGTSQTRGSWKGVLISRNSTGNIIENALIKWAYTAIDVYGARATIKNNVIRDFKYQGIYLRNGAYAFIFNNVIDNNYVTGGNNINTNGIAIIGPSTSSNIERNIIKNTDTGLYIYNGASPQITNGNRITENKYGLYLQGAYQIGRAVDPVPLVTGNSIYDNGISETGIRMVGRDYYAISWKNKNIVLNAKENWWGTADINSIANRIKEAGDGATFPIVNFGNYLDMDGGRPVNGNYIYGETDDATWSLTTGEIYTAITTLTVPAGKILTIPEGVKFNFLNNKGINVNGTIAIKGAIGSPIIFDSVNVKPAAGNWSGIRIYAGGVVGIDCADIRHATYGVRFNAGSTGSVTNSTITLNNYGIYAYGDDNVTNNPNPVVTDNNIFDNGIIAGTRYIGRDYYASRFGDTANVVLEARNNWWGTADVSAIANRIYEHTDSPSYSPVVNFGDYLDGTGGTSVGGNYLFGQVYDTIKPLQADKDYTVISTLNVPANTKWTIPAGVHLLFTPNTELSVDGNLVINGVQDNEVIFFSAKLNPAISDWKGIRLNAGATILMDYAIVEYAQNGLYFDSASGTVSNSMIRFNANGVYITGLSNPWLTKNRIVNNKYYGINIFGTNSNATNPRPVINSNDIYGNAWGELYVRNFGTNSSVVLDITGNWWGIDSPREYYEIKFGGNTPGAGSGFVNFSGYATTPLLSPVITAFMISESYISPNGDGNKDVTIISATTSTNTNWTLTISDATASVIRSFTGTGSQISQAWDGLNTSSQIVPDGAYRVDIRAIDATTGTGLIPVSGAVVVNTLVPIAVISSPSDSDNLSDIIVINGTTKGAVDSSKLTYIAEYASTASLDSWFQIGSGLFQNNSALALWATNSYRDEVLVPNGAYTIRLTVSDSLSGTVATDQVTVNVNNMLITNVIRSNDKINPVRNETATINFDINQPANVVLRMVPETVNDKVYPDQTPEAEAIRTIALGTLNPGTHSAIWDGRDDAGNFVAGDAYLYVIEARSLTGGFDKFNEHVIKISNGQVKLVIPPSDVASYNPYKNEFISSTFSNTYGAFRGSFCVAYTDAGRSAYVYPYPQKNVVWPPGSITVFWNGRDNSGKIATGFQSIVYELCSTIGIFARRIRDNYILVEDGKPDVPGISIKSDPYIIYLSYGQITSFKYSLLDEANVTVSVKDPGAGTITILQNNLPQTAGDYEVPWDGFASGGGLVPTEGHYTLIVTATHPVTGQSIVRVGNISVFQ